MFSIIVPVFNVEKYLRQCLDSVIQQSFQNFEVICVNDGSTDRSLSILQEYLQKDTRIKLIDQANSGLSAARNAGIDAAKGEYVFFLDSDDWIEPDTLKILSEKQNGEDLVCFNGRRYFEDGTTEKPDSGIEETQLTGWEYYNKYALASRKFHFVCTVLRIYKKDFLEEHNLMFEEGIYHEDNLFTPIVCYNAGLVKIIPDCLYIYRIREGSITQSVNVQRIYDLIRVANVLSTFFIPLKNIDKTFVYREIAGEYYLGFTLDKKAFCGNFEKQLIGHINWKNFKQVSVYKRHRLIYRLLRVHPALFRGYIFIEQQLKQITNK